MNNVEEGGKDMQPIRDYDASVGSSHVCLVRYVMWSQSQLLAWRDSDLDRLVEGCCIER